MRRSHWLSGAGTATALAAVYFIAGKLGLMLAFLNASATAVWPPSGISLAALLVFGYRVWPGAFLGAFLVNISTAGSVATSLGIATGNTLEALVGAYLVNRFANGRHAFDRAQDVFRFAFLAAMSSTTISATFGLTSLSLGGYSSWSDYGPVWLTWWLGDASGDLIVAPVALLWYLQPRLNCNRKESLEAALLLLSVVAVGLIAFAEIFPHDGVQYPLGFLCIPLMVWIAARFGQRETATANFLLAAVATWGTLRGLGPLVRASPHESLLLLQAFMGVVAMMGMALSASLCERKRLEAHLMHLADHDPLTDLLSRRGFQAELYRQLAEAFRYDMRGALLFLDLDDFKRVNDDFGHAAGDQALNSVGALLRARLRDTDLLARLGGDEFAILLPHASQDQAQALAMQVLEAIRHHAIPIQGRTVSVRASIGIASFPDHGRSVNELLAAADAAMYRAKAAGGDRCFVYSPEIDRMSENERPDALTAGHPIDSSRLLLYAEPVMDLRRNRISQYELSPQLDPHVGGALSANAVLAAAERSGVSHAIDRWVVSQAIGLLTRPEQRARGLQIFVKLTTHTLTTPGFVPALRRELLDASVDPRRLILEVSEMAATSDTERMRAFLGATKALGCQTALGHFGMSFSSISHLKRLPVDYLKIDPDLIHHLQGDRVYRHLVEAIVEISRALGPKTVGAGVEDSDTMALLRDCGVDYAQGPQVGRPRPATDIWPIAPVRISQQEG